MKKLFVLFFAIVSMTFSGVAKADVALSTSDLSCWSNSSVSGSDIVFSGAWGMAVWYYWQGTDLSGYESVELTVITDTDMDVKLYVSDTESNSISTYQAGITANTETTLTLTLTSDVTLTAIEQIGIQNSAAGTVTVVSAKLIEAADPNAESNVGLDVSKLNVGWNAEIAYDEETATATVNYSNSWGQVYWDMADADLSDYEAVKIVLTTSSTAYIQAYIMYTGEESGTGYTGVTGEGDATIEYTIRLSLDNTTTVSTICLQNGDSASSTFTVVSATLIAKAASGIEEVKSAPVASGVYSLGGARLTDDAKGLVIKNGKLVLLK